MDRAIWDMWVQNWQWTLAAMERKGFEVGGLEIGAPVSREEIERVQRELQIILPDDFVYVVTHFAGSVQFSWHLGKFKLPEPYRGIFSGGASPLWSMSGLRSDKEGYDGWVQNVFSNLDDPYDRVWHNKTAFLSVPNGDVIAFDVLGGGANAPVVYLSHEGDTSHGWRLGFNFVDFISRWSNIGCPGPEDWQFEPFYDPVANIIRDAGPVVDAWKDWMSN